MRKITIGLLPLLLLSLVVTAIGCGGSEDKPSLSEKDVLERVYDYCVSRCEQLHGFDNEDKVFLLYWQLYEYLIIEVDENTRVGESVTLELGSPPFQIGDPPTVTVYEGALKQIVKYQGNGLWSVTLFEEDTAVWEVNDLTKEVKPNNEIARLFIESTTLKTYHNNKELYSIDYNPSWVVDDTDKGLVTILPPYRDTEFIIISAGVQPIYQELSGYVTKRVNDLRELFDDFHLTDLTNTTIEHTFSISEDDREWIAKHHFVQQGSVIYEITCGSVLITGSDVESMLNDPYNSFRLQLP